MGKKKRALFSPKFRALREGKFSKITKEDNMKIKFIPRAKRKALQEKLATLETFSDEAKAIRGQLGWGEPAPPAPPAPKPKPVVEAPPAPKPAPKARPVSESVAEEKPKPRTRRARKPRAKASSGPKKPATTTRRSSRTKKEE